MDYKIYNSKLIVENQHEMIKHADDAYEYFKKYFNEDSTWSYGKYNFFSLTSPSQLYYNLFMELKTIIKDFVPKYNYAWIQCWLNYHHSDQVLDWHTHNWDYHGYISIDPKKTRTIFRDYEIVNQVGNIYIGPGNREHKVVVDVIYSTPRITLGFDIMIKNEDKNFKLVNPHNMFSLIPI